MTSERHVSLPDHVSHMIYRRPVTSTPLPCAPTRWHARAGDTQPPKQTQHPLYQMLQTSADIRAYFLTQGVCVSAQCDLETKLINNHTKQPFLIFKKENVVKLNTNRSRNATVLHNHYPQYLACYLACKITLR